MLRWIIFACGPFCGPKRGPLCGPICGPKHWIGWFFRIRSDRPTKAGQVFLADNASAKR